MEILYALDSLFFLQSIDLWLRKISPFQVPLFIFFNNCSDTRKKTKNVLHL